MGSISSLRRFFYLRYDADAPDREFRPCICYVNGYFKCSCFVLYIGGIRFRTAPCVEFIAADSCLLSVDRHIQITEAVVLLCAVDDEYALALCRKGDRV